MDRKADIPAGAILGIINGKWYSYQEVARLEGANVNTVSIYVKTIHEGESDRSSL